MSHEPRASWKQHAAPALCLALCLALPAAAAPLDALLTALPEQGSSRVLLELGGDKLARTLDFSTAREGDPAQPASRSGDYSSLHLTGAVRVADGLWLTGGLWQRQIDGDQDRYRYRGWLASGLWRFTEAAGPRPALAMRLSAWGNRASETLTTTPVHVPGAVLDTVTISKPSDRQLQADLLATWKTTPKLNVTAMLGLGRTRLAYGALAATTTRNGCHYDLTFTGNDIFGELNAPCTSSSGVIRQFFDSSGDYGVDVAKEIAWQGRFVQVGVNAAWRDGPWSAAAGLLLHSARRDEVDRILRARGDPAYQHNRTVLLDGGYAYTPQITLFARLQLSSHLFLDEIPVTYNSSTSRNFGSGFSTLTLGLRGAF